MLVLGGGGVLLPQGAKQAPATRSRPRKLAKVERINLTRSVVATGKIEAANKVEIKSKASGIIQKLPFDVGQYVRARAR